MLRSAIGQDVAREALTAKLALLAALVQHTEPAYQPQFDQLDRGLREGLLKTIVGFTIRIDQLEGKFKPGQHRLAEDQPGMQAWHEAGGGNERAIAQWMQRLGHWA
ncbi:MAG: transcriptional regulator [Bradyrhizobium sp.]